MNYYKIKTLPIAGTNDKEIIKKAMAIFHSIEKRTKRRPFLKCKAMDNSKIFIGEYVTHQSQKSTIDRRRRLKLFPCAVELMESSTYKPTKKIMKNGEILYRMYGEAGNGQKFTVQIAENPNNQSKRLMSSFPRE